MLLAACCWLLAAVAGGCWLLLLLLLRLLLAACCCCWLLAAPSLQFQSLESVFTAINPCNLWDLSPARSEEWNLESFALTMLLHMP